MGDLKNHNLRHVFVIAIAIAALCINASYAQNGDSRAYMANSAQISTLRTMMETSVSSIRQDIQALNSTVANLVTCANKSMIYTPNRLDADKDGCSFYNPSDLIYNINSSHDCMSQGGAVVSHGKFKFCRFNRSSCPDDWLALQNWSASSTITNPCRANGHSWSNRAAATCQYLIPGSCAGQDQDACSPGQWVQRSATTTQVGCY